LVLSDEELQLISDLVRARCGINLTKEKRNLIIARLQRELCAGGFESFRDYYEFVCRDQTGHALLRLVDRISTHHTFFFREKEHFDFLKDTALPQICRAVARRGDYNIRIWSAGCASGEEAYSLAMILHDYFSKEFGYFEVGILATDISVTALERAVAGIYSKEEITRVPPLYRQRYFVPLKDGRWAVREELKRMVLFRRLNLVRSEYPFKRRFHVIFCRNVMIYFDLPTQHELLRRFHRYTEPDGYLFVGHTEAVDRSLGLYRFVSPSVYQKVEAREAHFNRGES